MNAALPSSCTAALAALWALSELPAAAVEHVVLQGADRVVPSSFAVGTAAQTTIAAAALAACEFAHVRGAARQQVTVDMRHAALECVGAFKIDGHAPPLWEKFSGLYQCADGWVRVHANFEHHRNGALRILGLNADHACRADAERTMLQWRALDFEHAAAEAGLVATALRTFAEWDQTPQGIAVAAQPLLSIERIGEAAPFVFDRAEGNARPLTGVRALDLTRVLAGPVAGRTLAAYGADVMLINAPHLPNISAIAETSRGKLSAHLDLRAAAGREAMTALLHSAHVFIQGYRPGGIESLGFGATDAARIRPGIVYVSLSAYGREGPWAPRRGFDSLTQTAMGFNHAEREAAGDSKPRPLPMQILDLATGYLIAMSVSAALARQQREGGSWHINVSLAQTAQWLRSLGRVPNGFAIPMPDATPFMETTHSGFGALTAIRHAAQLSRTPAVWTRPSMPPGSHLARWQSP
jgi:crotonobetainyl-CoA:carnitine CoA-transferase CaiB-like acyl-CoA transferase